MLAYGERLTGTRAEDCGHRRTRRPDDTSLERAPLEAPVGEPVGAVVDPAAGASGVPTVCTAGC